MTLAFGIVWRTSPEELFRCCEITAVTSMLRTELMHQQRSVGLAALLPFSVVSKRRHKTNKCKDLKVHGLLRSL
jgi:hypothetical protein